MPAPAAPEPTSSPVWRRRPLVAAAVANVAFFAVVAAVIVEFGRRGVPAVQLLHDFVSPLLHWGLLSDLGILVWCFAAGACLLAAAVLPRGSRRALFLGVGLLTCVLAASDLMLLHDHIFPRWFGISGTAVVGAYGVWTLALLVRYHRIIWALPTRWLLVVAAVGFAISVGLDELDTAQRFEVAEDLAKMVGIVNWALGWGLAAVAHLRPAPAHAAGGREPLRAGRLDAEPEQEPPDPGARAEEEEEPVGRLR